MTQPVLLSYRSYLNITVGNMNVSKGFMFYEVHSKTTLDMSFSDIYKCSSSPVLASAVPVNSTNSF